MSMRMLIDARHREETRVAVVKGNRIEEFDFESEEHKQLKGNIYLAKVTRVEPSLQAAFVDYGGNRHGFLAFSEIHPDYYQIPKEDREALLREEAEHAAEEEALRAREDDEDEDDAFERSDDDGDFADAGDDDAASDGDDEDAPAPRPTTTGGDDNAVENLRQKRMNLRRRYKIQDVIRRRQVLLVQVVKEERGNKGAALTTYLSLAGRYCVLMPNTSHGGGISRKISNASDRKRLKSILADLNLPRSMGCIVRTAGLQRTRAEIKRDFDYLARLWDEIRERTLTSAAPAEIYRDSDLIKRAIRDIYSKDIDEILVEGEDGYHAARSFMKLLMPAHAKRIQPYSDAIPLFQRYGVEDQLAAMYQPVVQLKSGGYIVINPTEALVSIDINSGRSTREHNIEQTATATNLEAAQEIARQLRLRDMAGLVVIDFIDMENGSNNRKVERAMKEALKNDRARIQVGRISSFGLFEMSRQRLRTGVLEASTRICPHCEGTGFIRTASSSGLQALRLLEEEAARGRGSRLCLRASQEAALYVLNRKRAELADIEDRYGVMIEIRTDGTPEGARMSVEASGPPPSHAPRLPQQIVAEPDDDLLDDIEDVDEEEVEADAEAERPDRSEREEREGEAGGRRRRRRRRRGGRRDEESRTEGGESGAGEGELTEEGEAEPAEDEELALAQPAGEEEERGRRGRRGRRGGRRRNRNGSTSAEPGEDVESADSVEGVGLASDEDAVDPVTDGDLGDEVEAQPVAIEDALPPELPVESAPAASVEAEAVAEPEKPAPRRRTRARKTAEPAAAPADAEPAVAAAPVEAPAAEAAEEPAPKRVRKSRKKADAEPAVETAAERAPAEGETPAPKPTRRRRKTAAEPVTDLAAEAQPDATGQPAEPVVEPTGDAQPRADDQPVAEATDAAAETPAGAPRRGWWQRTFGA
ncbi:ribonuclease E/G [uncultured Sphingomonas sp.]|uniref:Rne/Rng family ribonuclease n=1 Tax=uncultured Sphingomonas sp. TaxID=158754 RepID=UPI0025FC52E3|nr:ribonuclease E/G [uncultured Sphingomonas sp.]